MAYAYHNDGYGSFYYEQSFSEPWFGPVGYRRPRLERNRGSNQEGYRCYYHGKDGSCMNYSYRHGGSSWNTWEDEGIYPPMVRPYEARPYGYDYGYNDDYGYYGNDRWNDCGDFYSPYGY
jgi:hypothetical protein